MNPLARLSLHVRRGFGRVVPDPFSIAVGLTAIVMLATMVTGRDPLPALRTFASSDGLWKLLVFTLQMSLMLVLGTALAAAPPIARGLRKLVSRARTPRALVGLTALTSIVLALVNWSLGVIGGALVAREAGRQARLRGFALHYPILCAAGYAGMMVWHGGLSGSAPLKSASRAGMVEVLGEDLTARIGVIPLDASLGGTLNLLVSGGLLVLGPLLFMALTPPAGTDPDPAPPPSDLERVPDRDPGEAPAPTTLVERIDASPVVTWMLAVPMAAALGLAFAERGFGGLDFDTVNLTLWTAALVLHGRPLPFLRACEEGARSCTGILLQFPLYGAIMGMMSAAGFSTALAAAFADVGAGAYLVVGFLSAGLLNLFIPSGGGQWAVQGPILMEGALVLGVEPSSLVMAVAYGDQWTNMLQPFWALPLLALTGVRARDIVGYTSLWMLAGGIWIAAMLLVAG